LATRSGGARRNIKLDVAEGGLCWSRPNPRRQQDDIQVSIGNQVTIGAEVKRETEEKKGARVRTDVTRQRVFRGYALPGLGGRRARRNTKTACWSSRSRNPVIGRKLTIQ
jgi:hypothetical protein